MSTWRYLVLLLAAAIFIAIIYRWISLERLQRFAPAEVPSTPSPEPTPTPSPADAGSLVLSDKSRVLIVDDNWFFAAGLRVLIDNEDDLLVCDCIRSEQHLVERIHLLRPHLLVIDLSLGQQSGLDVARRLRKQAVLTPILFISSAFEPTPAEFATVQKCSFAQKGSRPTEVLKSIRKVLANSTTSPHGDEMKRLNLHAASTNDNSFALPN